MKHIGSILKNHIETNHLKKRDVAEKVGISYNYLSTLFNKSTCDCELWEKLCVATGINPAVAFEAPVGGNKSYSDIHAQTIVGPATVNIASEQQALRDLLDEKERLLDEKERLIQVLLATSGIKIETKSDQNQ